MRLNSLPLRVPLALATVLVTLTSTGCGVDVSAPGEEEPPPPGFAGDWVGTFQGSEMTLRISPFLNGRNAQGRVIWEDVDWALACTALVTDESAELDCEVTPSAEVAFCGNPDPFIAIETAEPRERLEATVGGEIRVGTGTPCDGDVITSWEPAAGVVFTLP